MSKKRNTSGYLSEGMALISREQIKRSVEHTWSEDNYCKEWDVAEKTYYIYEGLLKWAKLSKDNHLFLLEVLLELNEQDVLDESGEQEEIINRIKRAIVELNQ
jgi:hypothetical protein